MVRYLLIFVVLMYGQIYAQQSQNTTLIGRWPNGPCYATFVVGNRAYIGNGGAMEILDVSNPASPVYLGQVVTPSVISGIFVSGTYAYVADGWEGLRVIDVSNPTAPVEVGFYDTGWYAWDVYVSGSYAYVADWLDGLRGIDVSDPTAPLEVGFFDTGGMLGTCMFPAATPMWPMGGMVFGSSM